MSNYDTIFFFFPEILFVLYSQILGYVAKGSFGPILKVKDKSKQKTYAVKVHVLLLFLISLLEVVRLICFVW